MTDQTKSTVFKKELFEWIKALLIAVVVVVLVRWIAFNPFIVDGQSMMPNFANSEKMIVNKLIYEIRDPKRGEVIVFLAPEGKDYIKRVIGVPGDKVRVDYDTVYINGEPLAEPYLQAELDAAKESGVPYNRDDRYAVMPEVTVPPDSLFVLGDNRSFSSDSREPSVGFVPYDKVVGRADLVYWPIKQFRFVSHKGG